MEEQEPKLMAEPFDINKEMTDEELESHFKAIMQKVGTVRDAQARGSVVFENGEFSETKYDPPIDLDLDIVNGRLKQRVTDADA